MDTVPSWNDYFMSLAQVASTRSKDPNTKVGAVLVTEDNRVIGLGFNGMPAGMVETNELWQRPTKYAYVVHAEMNAIHYSFDLYKRKNVKLYTTVFPCRKCMESILHLPITEIYYQKTYADSEESMKMAADKGVVVVKV